jgi:ATP-dependent Lon protease
VRELERKISKVCRKVARKGTKEIISKDKVEEYLGKRHESKLWSGVGVVNGLAWTQMGGKVLTVEVIKYQSHRQKIEITGQLGDVMK